MTMTACAMNSSMLGLLDLQTVICEEAGEVRTWSHSSHLRDQILSRRTFGGLKTLTPALRPLSYLLILLHRSKADSEMCVGDGGANVMHSFPYRKARYFHR